MSAESAGLAFLSTLTDGGCAGTLTDAPGPGALLGVLGVNAGAAGALAAATPLVLVAATLLGLPAVTDVVEAAGAVGVVFGCA